MAASDPIPVFTAVEDAHPIPQIALREATRYNDLAEHYRTLFRHSPTYIARAPGRVNLIGEHIDYALFGVCPMAVEQDVLVACAPRPSHIDTEGEHGHVNARNLETKYTPQSFAPMLKPLSSPSRTVHADADDADADAVHISEDPDPSHVSWHLDIDKTQLRWESYVKAGYYGVLHRFFTPHEPSKPVPVDILVTGSVPAGSGLSSSAAMVVASTLAFLAVNNKLDVPDNNSSSGSRRVTKAELVEMAVENERRVGVNSGGMDQAASVTSLPTSALYITFYPTFGAEPVPMPITRTERPAVFVCAHSGVICDKVVGAKTRYNLRVVETLVAARILARQLNLTSLLTSQNPKFTLREVLSAYVGATEGKRQASSALSLQELEHGLEKLLVEVTKIKASALRGKEELWGQEEGLTMEEMVHFTGLLKEEFHEIYLSWVDVEASHFQLYKRAMHVFSEALRVLRFRTVCITASAQEPAPQAALHTLGALMHDSQQSCSQLFECSCPELDTLTSIAEAAGAYGSRLTGAGWGGCTISLVAVDHVESFLAQLKKLYTPYHGLTEEQMSQMVFVTQPSSGAFVFKMDQ